VGEKIATQIQNDNKMNDAVNIIESYNNIIRSILEHIRFNDNKVLQMIRSVKKVLYQVLMLYLQIYCYRYCKADLSN